MTEDDRNQWGDDVPFLRPHCHAANRYLGTDTLRKVESRHSRSKGKVDARETDGHVAQTLESVSSAVSYEGRMPARSPG